MLDIPPGAEWVILTVMWGEVPRCPHSKPLPRLQPTTQGVRGMAAKANSGTGWGQEGHMSYLLSRQPTFPWKNPPWLHGLTPSPSTSSKISLMLILSLLMRRREPLSDQFSKYDLSPSCVSYVQTAVQGARRNKAPFCHVFYQFCVLPVCK